LSVASGKVPSVMLLAAGEGRRFGGIKQLAQLDGEPMCRRVARQLLTLDCPLVVVTGAHAEAVEKALDGLPLDTVRHPQWRQGMGSSLALGARHVLQHHAATTGVLLCLADQPLIETAHYRRLLARHRRAPDRLLCTVQDDVTGPPVLFPADCLAELAAWSDSRGAHALLVREAARLERFVVPAQPDVDTPEDLERVRAHLRRSPPV
jgi:molybdenum cofactor cytidylyltransferase